MSDTGTPTKEIDMIDHFKQFERSKTSIIGWYAFCAVVNLCWLWFYIGLVAHPLAVVFGVWLALIAIEDMILIGLALQKKGENSENSDNWDVNIWIVTRIVELFTVTFLVANTWGVWGLFLVFWWMVWIVVRITPLAWLMTLI